jgi:hypothetical protein
VLARGLAHLYVVCKGGWPTFTFFVKVGTHAADAGSFILASPRKDNSGSCSTATAAPTFTKNGGWPTFAVLAKVGIHAVVVGIFIFDAPR